PAGISLQGEVGGVSPKACQVSKRARWAQRNSRLLSIVMRVTRSQRFRGAMTSTRVLLSWAFVAGVPSRSIVRLYSASTEHKAFRSGALYLRTVRQLTARSAVRSFLLRLVRGSVRMTTA